MSWSISLSPHMGWVESTERKKSWTKTWDHGRDRDWDIYGVLHSMTNQHGIWLENDISDSYVPCKIVSSSIAFASASKGSHEKGRRLLKAATTDPRWSLIITPTPIMPSWEKIAASTLTLYQENTGGTQWPSMASFSWVGRRCASWKSCNMERARLRISCRVCLASPRRVLFRLNHALHAIVTTNLISVVSMCCLKSRYHMRSMKDLWMIPVLSNGTSERV